MYYYHYIFELHINYKSIYLNNQYWNHWIKKGYLLEEISTRNYIPDW
jgi:hypothetical protein